MISVISVPRDRVPGVYDRHYVTQIEQHYEQRGLPTDRRASLRVDLVAIGVVWPMVKTHMQQLSSRNTPRDDGAQT
jgi:hypothetical protein